MRWWWAGRVGKADRAPRVGQVGGSLDGEGAARVPGELKLKRPAVSRQLHVVQQGAAAAGMGDPGDLVDADAGLQREASQGGLDADSWLNRWPVRSRTSYPLRFGRDARPVPKLCQFWA